MLAGVTPRVALAQQTSGALRVTVVDSSGAVIVGATVTVTGLENATRAVTPAPAQTSPQGVATISPLVPGRYAVDATFPRNTAAYGPANPHW
jgi:hypothetical protein